jgi:hypothetical protein
LSVVKFVQKAQLIGHGLLGTHPGVSQEGQQTAFKIPGGIGVERLVRRKLEKMAVGGMKKNLIREGKGETQPG